MTVQYFIGGIGKDNSYGLASNKRVVLFTKSKSEFTAFDDLAEANRRISDPLEDRLYYWANGEWHQIHFLVEGGEGKKAIGFEP
jgi:hypothetical protein